MWACSVVSVASVGVGSLSGCAPAVGDQVELRLFPCAFEGLEPQAVVVEIEGLDADGATVESYAVGFDDIAGTTFADGYATVGYRKGPGVVTARFRVGWFSTPVAGPIDEAEAIAEYGELAVPAVGEVLSLGAGAEDCADLVAEGETGTGTGTGEESSESTSMDTEESSESTSADTAMDMEESSESTSMDTEESTDSESSTDTGGDDLPMPGDDCVNPGLFTCVPEPGGQAGTPLLCEVDSSTLIEVSPGTFQDACDPDICIGAADGCAGVGAPALCLCPLAPAPDCAPEELGCSGDSALRLCVNGQVAEAFCPGCAEEPGGYYSCVR